MKRFDGLKGEQTVRSFGGDDWADNRVFDMTDESKRKLIGTVIKANPQLFFKWETVEKYMDGFVEWPEWRNTWSERELYLLRWCENRWYEYNYINPYSQMEYDDWKSMNEEAEEEFIKEMIEKGIYSKDKYKNI